jgi:hypothetical protein
MLLAHCSDFDHLGMLIDIAGYKGAAVFLLEGVYGFLFYAQAVHNERAAINILCLLSSRALIIPCTTYTERKNSQLKNNSVVSL